MKKVILGFVLGFLAVANNANAVTEAQSLADTPTFSLTPEQVKFLKTKWSDLTLAQTYIGKYVNSLKTDQPLPVTFVPAPFPKAPARELSFNDILDLIATARPTGNFHLLKAAMQNIASDLVTDDKITADGINKILGDVYNQTQVTFLASVGVPVSAVDADDQDYNTSSKIYWLLGNAIFGVYRASFFGIAESIEEMSDTEKKVYYGILSSIDDAIANITNKKDGTTMNLTVGMLLALLKVSDSDIASFGFIANLKVIDFLGGPIVPTSFVKDAVNRLVFYKDPAAKKMSKNISGKLLPFESLLFALFSNADILSKIYITDDKKFLKTAFAENAFYTKLRLKTLTPETVDLSISSDGTGSAADVMVAVDEMLDTFKDDKAVEMRLFDQDVKMSTRASINAYLSKKLGQFVFTDSYGVIYSPDTISGLMVSDAAKFKARLMSYLKSILTARYAIEDASENVKAKMAADFMPSFNRLEKLLLSWFGETQQISTEAEASAMMAEILKVPAVPASLSATVTRTAAVPSAVPERSEAQESRAMLMLPAERTLLIQAANLAFRASDFPLISPEIKAEGKSFASKYMGADANSLKLPDSISTKEEAKSVYDISEGAKTILNGFVAKGKIEDMVPSIITPLVELQTRIMAVPEYKAFIEPAGMKAGLVVGAEQQSSENNDFVLAEPAGIKAGAVVENAVPSGTSLTLTELEKRTFQAVANNIYVDNIPVSPETKSYARNFRERYMEADGGYKLTLPLTINTLDEANKVFVAAHIANMVRQGFDEKSKTIDFGLKDSMAATFSMLQERIRAAFPGLRTQVGEVKAEVKLASDAITLNAAELTAFASLAGEDFAMAARFAVPPYIVDYINLFIRSYTSGNPPYNLNFAPGITTKEQAKRIYDAAELGARIRNAFQSITSIPNWRYEKNATIFRELQNRIHAVPEFGVYVDNMIEK